MSVPSVVIHPPFILVDGVEMDPNLLDPETIDNILRPEGCFGISYLWLSGCFRRRFDLHKRGKDQPMQIQYSNNLTFAKPIYVPSMYDSYTYAIAFNQARANAGLGPTFPDEQVERIKDIWTAPILIRMIRIIHGYPLAWTLGWQRQLRLDKNGITKTTLSSKSITST